MTNDRIWLDIPYEEKDDAKALGAQWDRDTELWYAPRAGMAELEAKWPVARPELPALLSGEDRSFGSGLFVDLVPSSCWFTNVRSCVGPKDWRRLRRMIVGRAEHRCETCGRGADREVERWLEAYERWAYDEEHHVQSLRRLVCLCTDCHTATHFGLAGIRGKATAAREHLMTVTGMSVDEVDEHIRLAVQVWKRRSQAMWDLDLSLLEDADIEIKPPPSANDRDLEASSQLGTARTRSERRRP